MLLYVHFCMYAHRYVIFLPVCWWSVATKAPPAKRPRATVPMQGAQSSIVFLKFLQSLHMFALLYIYIYDYDICGAEGGFSSFFEVVGKPVHRESTYSGI